MTELFCFVCCWWYLFKFFVLGLGFFMIRVVFLLGVKFFWLVLERIGRVFFFW